MPFTLPDLPYSNAALAPHISERTLNFHHGRHHAGYVAGLNRLLAGSAHENSTVDRVVVEAGPGAVFNCAAQAWNHSFYWNSMSPDGGGDPSGELGRAISGAFGSVDGFRAEFAALATAKFGSGWTWLVQSSSGLRIVSTDDADTPLCHDLIPLLTIDVWEHAYYLDYQNARAAYVDAFIERLLNWDFAAANYAACGAA